MDVLHHSAHVIQKWSYNGMLKCLKREKNELISLYQVNSVS